MGIAKCNVMLLSFEFSAMGLRGALLLRGGGSFCELDSVLLAPTPEGGLIHAQYLRCFLKRSGGGKHAAYMQFFDLFQVYRITYVWDSCRRDEIIRQALDVHLVFLTEDCGAFDHVMQLTKVSGPIIPPECIKRLLSEAEGRPVTLPAKEGKESLRYEVDIFGALPEWREHDWDHVQPVKEVFPEPALFYSLIQVGIGGGNNPDIGSSCRGITYALVLLVLKKTEELRLKRERKLTDFVQEKRPALAGCYASGVITDSSGKGSFHMSKELTLQKLGRE